MSQVGRRQLRMEDEALISGRGRYVDDLHLPGMIHISIVRSSVARARLRNVDVRAARNAKGVIAVFTAESLPEPARIMADTHPSPLIKAGPGTPVLAGACVRYVGEPIVAVVATSPYLAEDAAELVSIEYEELSPIIDLEVAIQPGSDLVHDFAPLNIAGRIPVAKGDVEKGFSQAARVVRRRLEIHRGAGGAMETRGIVAAWDPLARRMVVWNVSQVPFVHRTAIAKALGLPENSVQVMNGDVGGGFGYKGLPYVEDVLIPTIAQALQAPVKWIEDRREHLIAAYQERTQIQELEMALDSDGAIVGVRGRILHDHGAYSVWGATVPLLTAVNVPGPYKMAHYSVEALAVYTNTTPVAPVRGAGRPQAVFAIERLLDAAAEELQLDRVEIRRRNLIQANEYPYDVGFISRDGTRRIYDSGDIPGLLDRALDLINYEEVRARQKIAREAGKFIGFGLACVVEESGLGPYEQISIGLEDDGTATVMVGTPSQGQGQKTVFAQIAAAELSLPVESVRVMVGNTDYVRHSIGTFASRAGIVTGSAVLRGAIELRGRLLRLAANLLQAPESSLSLDSGYVCLKGDRQRGVSFAELVRLSIGEAGKPLTFRDLGPGMTVTESFCPPTNVFPTGVHAAVVEVDPQIGEVRIKDYVAVEDFGNVINPLIVEGQVIGGVAHGLGNSLYERVVLDEQGQNLTANLADYLMPTANDVPRIKVELKGTPSPLNPLGMKGAGQGGTIPVPAVVIGAVEDALRPLGIVLSKAPLSESELAMVLHTRAEPTR